VYCVSPPGYKRNFSEIPKIRTSKLLFKRLRTQHVEPSGVQALKNPNPLKDVEALAVLAIVVLF